MRISNSNWKSGKRPGVQQKGKTRVRLCGTKIQLLQSPRLKGRMAKHRYCKSKELPEGDFKVSPRQNWRGRGGSDVFEDTGSVPTLDRPGKTASL